MTREERIRAREVRDENARKSIERSKKALEKKLNIFWEAMSKNFGNISASEKAAGLSNTYAYKLRDKDPEFAAKLKEAREKSFETSEEYLRAKLYEHIDNNNLTALIFMLKCKAGYRDSEPPKPAEQMLTIKIEKADQ